jgi:hypothetical protein
MQTRVANGLAKHVRPSLSRTTINDKLRRLSFIINPNLQQNNKNSKILETHLR